MFTNLIVESQFQSVADEEIDQCELSTFRKVTEEGDRLIDGKIQRYTDR